MWLKQSTMDLSILKAALVFQCLIIQQVNSSISSISKYQISSKDETDNDLENFVNNFKMVYLEKRVPRHITIVGASAEDLPQIQQLFEIYPSIICTEPKTCVYRSWFSRGSFVIIFLNDLREDTIERNFDILSLCRECKVLYIIRGMIQTDGISLLFNKTLREYGANSQLAHLDKNVTKFYGNSVAKNCSIVGRLIVTWRPGVPFDFIDTWTSSLPNLNGCLITVSTLNFPPTMLIEKHDNLSSTIRGGLEGQLILALAEKLNFKVRLMRPSLENQKRYSRKTAILLAVASGEAAIGIGRLRPTGDMDNDKMAFSIAYDHECVTWGVPNVIIRAEKVVWMEFSWPVWALVGLVFAITCMIGSTIHNIDPSTNGKDKKVGFVATCLENVAIHVGSPVVNIPYTLGGKFLLMIYLHYAMVVTTAYKTSLASILTADNGSPGIVDSEGILAANLSVGGADYLLELLKDQADGNETISKLIDRFVVINRPLETMRRINCDGQFAGISRLSAMLYLRKWLAMNREQISFNILGDCVLPHETVIVFSKKLPLREPVNHMIRRIVESGIPNHWDSTRFLPKDNTERISSEGNDSESSTRNKFKHIFFFHLSCVAFCFFAFLIEMGMSIAQNSKKI